MRLWNAIRIILFASFTVTLWAFISEPACIMVEHSGYYRWQHRFDQTSSHLLACYSTVSTAKTAWLILCHVFNASGVTFYILSVPVYLARYVSTYKHFYYVSEKKWTGNLNLTIFKVSCERFATNNARSVLFNKSTDAIYLFSRKV